MNDQRASTPLLVLLVEDGAADARLIQDMLDVAATDTEDRGRPLAAGRETSLSQETQSTDTVDLGRPFVVCHVMQLAAALPYLRSGAEEIAVILLDLGLPDSPELESLISLHAAAPHLPIVVVGTRESDALAIQCVRYGAQSYLSRPDVQSNLLVRTLHLAIERQRREQGLIASAETAWRASDRLLEDAAHHVRTPLTVILGRCELLQVSPGGGQPLPDKWVRDQVATIHQAARLLHSTLEQMLEQARKQIDMRSLFHWDTVDLGEVVSSVIATVNAPDEPVEAALVISEGITPGMTVMGVRRSLEDVVDALVEMARRQAVGRQTVHLTMRADGQWATLTIQAGRARRTHDRHQSGPEAGPAVVSPPPVRRGIDLWEARAIIEQHGGHIRLETGDDHMIISIALPLLTNPRQSWRLPRSNTVDQPRRTGDAHER